MTSVTEDFLNIKSKSHEEKIEKADHQNLKLCPLKDSWKDKHTGRKYLQHVCEKGTVYRIYKTLTISIIRLCSKEQTTQYKNGQKMWTDISQRKI